MKKLVHDDPECAVYLWNRGEQIDLLEHGMAIQVMPSQIHIKPDGDIHDQPSLCFTSPVLQGYGHVVMQISLAKLMPAIEAALLVKKGS